MKTCSICGLSNQDENIFCIHCGKPLAAEQTAIPREPFAQNPPLSYSTAPVPYTYGQPAESYMTAPVPGNPNTLNRIREIAGSPLMLIVILLWFLQMIIAILFSFYVTNSLSEPLIAAGLDISIVEMIQGFFNSFMQISMVFTTVISLLYGIGMILIYRSARHTEQPMKTGGISLIRGLMIFQLVCTCLGIAILLLMSFVLMFGNYADWLSRLPYQMDLDTLTAGIRFFGVILLVAALIGGAVGVLFSVLILKFLGSVKKSIATGWVHEKFATFVAVLAFIYAGLMGINILNSITALIANPLTGIYSLIASVLMMAIYGLLGLLITKYRKAVYSRY